LVAAAVDQLRRLEVAEAILRLIQPLPLVAVEAAVGQDMVLAV